MQPRHRTYFTFRYIISIPHVLHMSRFIKSCRHVIIVDVCEIRADVAYDHLCRHNIIAILCQVDMSEWRRMTCHIPCETPPSLMDVFKFLIHSFASRDLYNIARIHASDATAGCSYIRFGISNIWHVNLTSDICDVDIWWRVNLTYDNVWHLYLIQHI